MSDYTLVAMTLWFYLDESCMLISDLWIRIDKLLVIEPGMASTSVRSLVVVDLTKLFVPIFVPIKKQWALLTRLKVDLFAGESIKVEESHVHRVRPIIYIS